MVIVAAHLDASRAGIAVHHELHDRGRLLELTGVSVPGIELGLREDAARPDDLGVQARVNRHAGEAVGDVGRLEVAAFD